MITPAIPLADLTELESDFLSRANIARGWSEKSRGVGLRNHHSGVAHMAEDAAKRVRELIDRHAPKPPLLRLVRESADHG